MSWLLSAVGMLALWLLGRRSKTGFLVGLLSDVLWAVYSVQTAQWGFLPACAVYAVIHIHNYRKWGRLDEPSVS